MRILLRSGFDRFTGYGNDAVDIAIALEAAGADVVPFGSGVVAGLPRKFTRLFEKQPYGRYDAVLQFAPPFDIKPWVLTDGDKTFGWTMWERTPMVPSDFAGKGWGERLPWYGLTRMLVTCPMNVEALRSIDPEVPISVIPCGVASWPEQEHGEGPFRFGMVGMLSGRKEPFVLLEAWRELKRERPDFDAVLELKTATVGLHPRLVDVYPDVTIHTAIWPPATLLDFYRRCDVLVSTSRGEGNDKPCMEFMSTGGPVIATDWAGHQNWLHESWGYPVGGELEAHPGGWSDFRVDRDELKRRLLECWSNRGEVRRKGRAARGVMESRFSWATVADGVLREMALS